MKYLILLIPFLMGGCWEPKGKEAGIINPKKGTAKMTKFVSNCPLKVENYKEVPLSSLDGEWCVIRAKDCGEITSKYEEKECGQ